MLPRKGVARILGAAGLEVVASSDNADDLVARIHGSPPDVAIIDMRLPPTRTDEGMRAALHIRQNHPTVSVLVLSQSVELGLAMRLLSQSAEGVGYLLKDRVSHVGGFIDSVRRVGSGGSAIRPLGCLHPGAALAQRRSPGPAAAARAGSARVAGHRLVRPGDRQRAGDQRAASAGARLAHLRQARAPGIPASRHPGACPTASSLSCSTCEADWSPDSR